jgi:hypothetical protein
VYAASQTRSRKASFKASVTESIAFALVLPIFLTGAAGGGNAGKRHGCGHDPSGSLEAIAYGSSPGLK